MCEPAANTRRKIVFRLCRHRIKRNTGFYCDFLAKKCFIKSKMKIHTFLCVLYRVFAFLQRNRQKIKYLQAQLIFENFFDLIFILPNWIGFLKKIICIVFCFCFCTKKRLSHSRNQLISLLNTLFLLNIYKNFCILAQKKVRPHKKILSKNPQSS